MSLERSQVEQGTGGGVTFTQFIAQVAARAKLNIQTKSADLVIVPYDFGGRLQNTFVRPMGQTGAGHLIISFFSPCLKVPTGQEIGQKAANDLLRKNARIPHGAWAIASVDGAEYLGVQETHIAQTLQPEEFAAAAIVVAKLADDMEKQFGTDVF